MFNKSIKKITVICVVTLQFGRYIPIFHITLSSLSSENFVIHQSASTLSQKTANSYSMVWQPKIAQNQLKWSIMP